MFDARPIFGFGPATFPGQVVNFAGRVETAAREPTNAPHNLYAELAAEAGWVGLLGWAVVILGFLTVVLLGILGDRSSRDRVLAAAVCAALVAWSAASIGLHMAYFRTFGVVLALAVAFAPAWPAPVEAVRALVRGAAIWCLAGVAGFAAAGIYLSAAGTSGVTARQATTLVPVGSVDGSYSYALDVRSRVEFLPTFATLLENPDSPVDIVADPVRGILTFVTTADDAGRARDDIQRAVATADFALHNSIGYDQYALQTVGSMRVAATQQRSAVDLMIAAGAGVVTTSVAAALLLRAARRRRVADVPVPSNGREATCAPSVNA